MSFRGRRACVTSQVVDAALVASGPLLTDIGDDVYGQAQVMTNTTRILGGDACVNGFRAVFQEVARLAQGSAADRQLLAASLGLCEVPSGSSSLQTLRDWMQQAIVYYTLGSYPYPSTYMTLGVKPLPAYPIKEACQRLLVTPRGAPRETPRERAPRQRRR